MRHLLLYLIFSVSFLSSFSQNAGIGVGTTNPHPSAAFEISSSNQGFLPPRMTTIQRNNIQNPASGLQIYNTTTDCLEIFGKGKWNAIYCVPIDTTLVTDIDGNTYPTVRICEQTWMAKNLDVTRYRNGDIIPQVTDPTQWANLTTGAWCWYNNDSSNGSIYGRLYNWYAVNDPRGLAPAGWHVSSDAEWNQLVKCIENTADTNCINCAPSSVVGGFLKETGTTLWLPPNFGANDSFGFKSRPGGVRETNGVFDYLRYSANYFTSTEGINNGVLFRNNVATESGIWRGLISNNKNAGLSIRCVRDLPPPSTLDSGLVAYYPFNGNANDESGNGNNLSVYGATLTTDKNNNSNSAYQFNGTNNFMTRANPNFSFSYNSSFTTSCKILFNNINSMNYIMTSISLATGNYVWNLNYSNGNFQFGAAKQQINYWYNADYPISNLNTNQWYDIMTVYKNGVLSLYLNNVLVASAVFQGDANTNILPFSVGGVSYDGVTCPGGWFSGKIDDIRIYNRALSPAEITYLATH